MKGEQFLNIILLAIFVWMSLIDIRQKKIPNVALVCFLVATVLALCLQYPVNLAEHFWSVFVVSGILLVICKLRPGAFGAGDVKLMAIAGLLLGFWGNVNAFVIGVISAAVFCIIGMALKKVDRKTQIPFGPFLCLGIGLSLLFT